LLGLAFAKLFMKEPVSVLEETGSFWFLAEKSDMFVMISKRDLLNA